MHFKDNAPSGTERAVLTVYAKVVGESFGTALKQCSLSPDTELKYLSGSNAPVSKTTTSKAVKSAIGIPEISGADYQKIEYDITSMLPEDGGDFVFALLPEIADDDYIILPSHRNSEFSIRPRIKYYAQ